MIELIQANLDYAPTANGEEFTQWCNKHGFYPLNSGRRAWCFDMQTYFRNALGVATTLEGEESFFF